MTPVVTRIETRTVNVNTETDWTFIEAGTDYGLTGTGEATLYGAEKAIAGVAAGLSALPTGSGLGFQL